MLVLKKSKSYKAVLFVSKSLKRSMFFSTNSQNLITILTVKCMQELYAIGGRAFWVLNMAPVGCYPAFLVQLPHNSSDLDPFGCLISYNNAVVYYNNLLKEALSQTRKSLPNASLIYVDTYSIVLKLSQHPTSHGIVFSLKVFSTGLQLAQESFISLTA